MNQARKCREEKSAHGRDGTRDPRNREQLNPGFSLGLRVNALGEQHTLWQRSVSVGARMKDQWQRESDLQHEEAGKMGRMGEMLGTNRLEKG